MEREFPPYRAAVTKPARPSIWPTLIVGAVLATVIGGGVYPLGQTRAKWEANRAGKAERAAAFERQWQQQQDAETSRQMRSRKNSGVPPSEIVISRRPCRSRYVASTGNCSDAYLAAGKT